MNGIKDCKNQSFCRFVSIWWRSLVNELKQSWKCPELKRLIKNKNCLFGNIQDVLCGKRSYINFWGKMTPFPKKWSNVPPKQFFTIFSENTILFFKFCRIKKYSTYQNISLLIHFLHQRFFDVLLWVVEKHNKPNFSHLEL